jgi:hypothetical protein
MIPRRADLTVRRTDPIGTIEPIVRAKWGLEDIELDFFVGDPIEDEWTAVSKTDTFETLDLATQAIAVRDPESELYMTQKAPGEDLAEEVMRSLSKSATASFAGMQSPRLYAFSVHQRGIDLSLHFDSGATVRDAKIRIAKECGVDGPEFVTLLLLGKALRDTFVLERVIRGPRAVAVVLRDLSEVMLVSAVALATRS